MFLQDGKRKKKKKKVLSRTLPRSWKTFNRQRKHLQSAPTSHQKAKPQSSRLYTNDIRPSTSSSSFRTKNNNVMYTSYISSTFRKSPSRSTLPTFFQEKTTTSHTTSKIKRLRSKASMWDLWRLASENRVEQLSKLLNGEENTAINALLNITDTQGMTPLIHAAKSGAEEALLLLMNKGANLFIQDNSGWDVFHTAAANGHCCILEALSLFLKHNKNAIESGKIDETLGTNHTINNNSFNTTTRNTNWTPLHFASDGGHLLCVEFILNDNAFINALTSQKYSPLMLACNQGHHHVVSLLLQRGADIAVFDPKNGETALHMACRNGFHGTARMLLDAGARMMLDFSGRSPLDHALAHNFPWILHVTPLQEVPNLQHELLQSTKAKLLAQERLKKNALALKQCMHELQELKLYMKQREDEIEDIKQQAEQARIRFSEDADLIERKGAQKMLQQLSKFSTLPQCDRALIENHLHVEWGSLLQSHLAKGKTWKKAWIRARQIFTGKTTCRLHYLTRLDAKLPDEVTGSSYLVMLNESILLQCTHITINSEEEKKNTTFDVWKAASSTPHESISPLLFMAETSDFEHEDVGIHLIEKHDHGKHILLFSPPTSTQKTLDQWWWQRLCNLFYDDTHNENRIDILSKELNEVMFQIVRGLEHLERLNISHRHISSDVILVETIVNSYTNGQGYTNNTNTCKKEDRSSTIVRISNFDSAIHTIPSEVYTDRKQLLMHADPLLAAPEVISAVWSGPLLCATPTEKENTPDSDSTTTTDTITDNGITTNTTLWSILKKSDVFAAGRIWLELLMKAQLFIDEFNRLSRSSVININDTNETKENRIRINRNKPPIVTLPKGNKIDRDDLLNNLGSFAKDILNKQWTLLRSMLSTDQRNRPSAHDIVQTLYQRLYSFDEVDEEQEQEEEKGNAHRSKDDKNNSLIETSLRHFFRPQDDSYLRKRTFIIHTTE